MAMQDGEDFQRAEKATLKRKLTGPPRLLLLGKSRSRSMEDRPETQTDESAGSDTETDNSRGCCEAAGEDDNVSNRNRRRWWRRFSPAVVCIRKQKKDGEEGLEKKEGSVPPEGALLETDAASLNNTKENMKGMKGRRRFNMFKRFLTSSDVQQTHEQERDFVDKDGDDTLVTFSKKMRNFFSRRGKSRRSDVPLENMEDVMKCEDAQVDELLNDVKVQSLEVMTVAAEMSVQLTEKQDKTPTEDRVVCDISVTEEDLTDAVNGPETIQTDSELLSLEKDSIQVAPVADDQLSTSATSDASEEKTTSRCLQPSTIGPSIRIELVPLDDVTQEVEEEEECWEGGFSTKNHNYHLLLFLDFEHSERQLVQTARSLVRAAMNAAVDQLRREQQSGADCVHREPPGCRDHA